MKRKNLLRYFLVTILSVLLIYTVVEAATTISDSISTGGTLTVTGATTLNSTLAVTGPATTTSASYFTGGFDSAASSTIAGLRVKGVATTTGITYTAGFDSSASSTVEGSLRVIEAATLSSTLTVAGAATTTGSSYFTGGFDSAASSTVQGNLKVTGTITGGSYYGATGTVTLYAPIGWEAASTTFTGDVKVLSAGNLNASGTAYLAGFQSNASSTVEGTLKVTDAATLSSTLTVAGAATTTGISYFTGGFDSAASSTVQGTLKVTGNATTSGLTFLQNGFDSAASSTVQGNLVLKGNARIGGTAFETWVTTQSVLQIGAAANILATTAAGGTLSITNNAYFDNTDVRWEYQDTDVASLYQQGSGIHSFAAVQSGTADAAITWVYPLRLSVSGATTTGEHYITNGFDSAASSTVQGDLKVVGNISASTTAYLAGFQSNASSTMEGNFTIAGPTSTAEMWINASTTVAGYLSVTEGFRLHRSDASAAGAGTTTSPIETCSAAYRGRLIFVDEVDDSLDTWLWVCGESAAGTYAWKLIDG